MSFSPPQPRGSRTVSPQPDPFDYRGAHTTVSGSAHISHVPTTGVRSLCAKSTGGYDRLRESGPQNDSRNDNVNGGAPVCTDHNDSSEHTLPRDGNSRRGYVRSRSPTSSRRERGAVREREHDRDERRRRSSYDRQSRSHRSRSPGRRDRGRSRSPDHRHDRDRSRSHNGRRNSRDRNYRRDYDRGHGRDYDRGHSRPSRHFSRSPSRSRSPWGGSRHTRNPARDTPCIDLTDSPAPTPSTGLNPSPAAPGPVPAPSNSFSQTFSAARPHGTSSFSTQTITPGPRHLDNAPAALSSQDITPLRLPFRALSSYSYLSPIDEGTYGSVTRARCQQSGASVAVKRYKTRAEVDAGPGRSMGMCISSSMLSSTGKQSQDLLANALALAMAVGSLAVKDSDHGDGNTGVGISWEGGASGALDAYLSKALVSGTTATSSADPLSVCHALTSSGGLDSLARGSAGSGLWQAVVREVVTLMQARGHKNVVRLEGIAVDCDMGVERGGWSDDEECSNDRGRVASTDSRFGSHPGSLSLILEYCEYDLKTVLQASPVPMLPASVVKGIVLQILQGLKHIHARGVMHRDIKTANILVNEAGIVKIADFGSARIAYSRESQGGDNSSVSEEARNLRARMASCLGHHFSSNAGPKNFQGSNINAFTTPIVTLWYRPPEVFFGARIQTPAIDMWSAGCIFAELVLGCPLFEGKGEIDQISMIFDLLGSPTKESWPDFHSLPHAETLSFTAAPGGTLHQRIRTFIPASSPTTAGCIDNVGLNLLTKMLVSDPAQRISAAAALDHPWFTDVESNVCKAAEPSEIARVLKELGCGGSDIDGRMRVKRRVNEEEDVRSEEMYYVY